MKSSRRLVDCFWLPQYGAEKLIQNIQKANKTCRPIIRTTDLASHVSLFFFTRPFSKLTSAKFQTFTYNSRMVWSSPMKF